MKISLRTRLIVHTISKLNIVFDHSKNEINIQQHQISLNDAVHFEWDHAITWRDLRRDYGEHRMAGLGYIGNRLFFIVFVDRRDQRRVISLRKANQREVKRYAKT